MPSEAVGVGLDDVVLDGAVLLPVPCPGSAEPLAGLGLGVSNDGSLVASPFLLQPTQSKHVARINNRAVFIRESLVK
jgi:hypothetical protein